MKDLMRVFENEQFGDIRVVMCDGEPWFVANDICKAIGVASTATRRLDEDEKGLRLTQTLGGEQKLVVVNEPGMYRLVLSSRKPEANTFRRWIAHDVIPAIRKTGGYIDDEAKMVDTYFSDVSPEQQEAIRKVFAEIRTLQSKVKTLAPKAEYSDAVLHAPDTIPTSTIAKDYGMSARQMNSKLHELKVQYKCGGTWLLYSQYQNKGYTNTETYINPRSGHQVIETRWTPGGRQFIYKKLKRHGILPKNDNAAAK